MPDDPSSSLEEIRGLISERDHVLASIDWALDASDFNAIQDKLAARVPRLLAAIEAVLELHQPVDRGAGAQCKGCATHVTFTWWPCPTYEAITAELTGKGGTDERP